MSDFGIRDSFVVVRDFSFDLALARWLKEHGIEEGGRFGDTEGSSEQEFLAYLRSAGFVEEEPLERIHLGDYGRPDRYPAGDAADEPPPTTAPTVPTEVVEASPPARTSFERVLSDEEEP